MSKIVFNETTHEWVDLRNLFLIRGVVNWDENHIEFGYFEASEDYRVVEFPGGQSQHVLIRTCTQPLYFNRARGTYSIVEPDNEIVFAHGDFPYSFDKFYSTRYLEEQFQAKNKITNEVMYNYIEELPYTFGMEFETSAGYIPEEELYRVGLIQLRDG